MTPSVYLLMILLTFLWGSGIPGLKLALETDPSLGASFSFQAIRLLVAGAVLMGLGAAFDPKSAESTAGPSAGGDATRRPLGLGHITLMGFLGSTLFFALVAVGYVKTSASSASVIEGLDPMIAAFTARLLRRDEIIDWPKWVALALGISGVVVLVVGSPATTDPNQGVSIIGCLLIMIGLSCSAAGTTLTVSYRGRLGLLAMTGAQMIAGALILGVVALVVGGFRLPLWLQSTRSLLLLAWLTAMTAFTYPCWFKLVKKYQLSSLSTLTPLISIWGAGLSIAFLGERPTVALVFALGLVCSGILVLHHGSSEHHR